MVILRLRICRRHTWHEDQMQRSVSSINSNDRVRSSSILWYAHTNLTEKKSSILVWNSPSNFLSTVIACGYVLVRLADTSMLGIECSSDKRIIGEIVDLTLSTNQIHSIHFVFLIWFSATNSQASPLTLRSAKDHSTGFRQKDDLLFSYPRFSLITTSGNFCHVDTNIQVHHLIHI